MERPSLVPPDLRVGDRVEFTRDASGQHAPDDPLYEPPVPAGMTGVIVKVGTDHVRVRLDDPAVAGEPVKIWQDGLFPDTATNTMRSLRKIG